jgi:flavin reductase (DIM6/NTAB) family NADH-FMN oxidoreductase RutF
MHPVRLMRPPLDSPESPEKAATLAGPPCLDSSADRATSARDQVYRDFRDALGSFATGVTVLTALAADGGPIGVTISSFNSVSLQPPLILWSLACDSPRLAAFRNASHYAVNVLAADQEWVSDCFANREDNRFNNVRVRKGLADVPLIEGCVAWFECSNEARYPGGDHLIFLGRVQRFARGEVAEPLVFHAGRYRQLRRESGK